MVNEFDFQIDLINDEIYDLEKDEALAFLCDGEALAKAGIVNQEAVESVYNELVEV